MRADVGVVEYGIGNVQSVANALRRVGARPTIVRTGSELIERDWEAVVMPGVGAIGASLRNVRERGLDRALEVQILDKKTPILGICVGMQMLVEICEEFGLHRGLSWLPGRVQRLSSERMRVPHIGWNVVRPTKRDSLFDGLNSPHMYFVHSYHVSCEPDAAIAYTNHDQPFTSAFRAGNVVGVQFHPEKSSSAGERLLSNFLNA
jgi:glutamine amidotransferase